jgi:uncharacterized membrane protein
MILGSLLLWLKPRYLLALALIFVIGTELLVPDPSLWGPGDSVLKLILLVPGGMGGANGADLWSNYPILAWMELVIFGMVFGNWLADNPKKAFKRAFRIGAAFLVVFAVLRYLDGFGNIRPRMGNSWMDILNLVKYPPSITYSLLTTGVNLIILALFSQVSEKLEKLIRPLAVFGQTPLFFYVLHLFLFAGLGRWLTPEGTSILAMYPYWLAGLLILFPLAWWYGRVKQRQPAKSFLRFL